MRYGLFSDIHSNLEAFQSVSSFLEKEEIQEYIFAGDIVGYGANPNECIVLLQGLIEKFDCICVAGNHDFAACDMTDINYFNPFAKEAVYWTKTRLGKDELSFLSKLEPVKRIANITIVHASLHMPLQWNYIFDLDDASLNFTVQDGQICIIGHSHRPIIFMQKQNALPDYVFEGRIKIEKDSKYIVNIGSVGQPRDGDPKAACCIYDTDTGEIQIKRVAYDIRTAQDKIIKAGLPPILAQRLSVGR